VRELQAVGIPAELTTVGVDVVDVDRFRRALLRRRGLLDRLFTVSEREYAGRFGDPTPHLAARFAAKEATMKALGVGISGFRFSDVEVVRSTSGQPTLRLAGTASNAALDRGARVGSVSLSHTATVALAVVAMRVAAPKGGDC
jgi:holo-[acyl-carrier protein] synthase